MEVLQISTATSGTVTLQDTQQDVVLAHDAGVTLTLTIALPSSPKDGQKAIITSASGITTLTLTAVVGTIINALSTLAAGSTGRYIYSASRNKWFRY